MLVISAPIEQFPVYRRITNLPVATNSNLAFPASNLLTYDLTSVLKTTSNSSVISWDFGENRIFNMISLLGTSITHQGTIKIEASLDNVTYTTLQNTSSFWPEYSAAQGAGPFAEDADPRKHQLEKSKSWFYSNSDLTYRYLRITLSDPGSTTFVIGRLFVGRQWRPLRSYQYGSTFNFTDTGSVERTDRGSPVAMEGRSIVSANLKMNFISSQEMYDYVYDFNVWRKTTGEMLACLDVNTQARLQKNVLYCRITEGRQVSADDFEAWSQNWTLESI